MKDEEAVRAADWADEAGRQMSSEENHLTLEADEWRFCQWP